MWAEYEHRLEIEALAEKAKKAEKYKELLQRWDDVILPDGFWQQPKQDYLLPLETQEALEE